MRRARLFSLVACLATLSAPLPAQWQFAADLGALRSELLDSKYSIGDFEFARHGVGTGFEAFVVLGEGIYLICNNTRASMDEITRDPKWLNAQVPFAELSEAVRLDPLAVSGDHTKFFKRSPMLN